MSSLWILVLIVASGTADSSDVRSMERTVQSAFGPEADVRVLEVDDDIPAEETVRAFITWDAPRTEARIRLERNGETSERRITFAPEDAEDERGRTLGFVLVSMLPEPALHAARPQRQLSLVTMPWLAALELAGAVSLGVSDDGASTSYGGSAAGIWFPAPALGLRFTLEARAGRISAAQASTLWLAATLGAQYSFVRATPSLPLDFDVRLDFGVARQSVSHFSDDDPDEVERWQIVPVANAWLEVGWRLTNVLAPFAGVGLESAFAQTSVFVAEERRAELGPFRAVMALGLRAGY